MKNTFSIDVKPLNNIIAKLKADPQLAVIGLMLIGIAIITLLRNRIPKKGKTARARWANADDLKNSKKAGLACVGKNSQFNDATYYIQEPIGMPPQQWKSPNQAKNILFFPQINCGTLVVGGAGWGKTLNFIEPAAISAIKEACSLVLFDYKFDNNGLAESLMPVAIDYGYQVRTLAPGSVLSGTFNIFDLIKNSADLAGAREAIGSMVRNNTSKDAKTDGFFDPGGKAILEGAFLMARWVAEYLNVPSYANILMASQILSLPNLSKRLELHREKIPPWCYSAFSILISSSGEGEKNNTEGGLLATANKFLSPMILPNFLDNFCGTSTFPRFDEAEPLKVDGKQMLVFGVNQANEQSTLPLIATALEQIVSYNLKYHRDRPLVIILDEFDTLNMPVVLDWLNRYRSSGCSLIIGIQYLGQLEKYGKARAEGFLASCATKIWYNPGNPETAKVLSDLLNKQEIELPTVSKSTSSGKGSGTNRTTGTQLHQVSLLEPQEPLNFPKGTCVIQSPTVGNKDEVGLPYKHSFKFSKKLNTKFRAECKRKYRVLCDVAKRGKPAQQQDYTQLMREYYQILNDILPLNSQTEEVTEDMAEPIFNLNI
ncbi:type IV secretory system conjugative DNA transfer family protein [Chamaesiphon minutus]|uniref:Type IV secretory pathway, VirD4 component n=1 Tax=Chamaesiphon minutus (strain ATCC 27169 / PCC 6605) TaxID=1173020 RepID=K9UEX7_CHAP6|nr:TraM recognition domain-containing protein [Chamaesiphon minutus]AFY92754.1 type IV secretory pathway, VirD4 component [Chamaesiphon minutus PCC 6605]